MGRCFTINILGQELSVLSDSGDEHVSMVIKYVNDKVKEVRNTSGEMNTLNIAILAALNIADEYIKYKGDKENIYNRLESRSENLINLINDIR